MTNKYTTTNYPLLLTLLSMAILPTESFVKPSAPTTLQISRPQMPMPLRYKDDASLTPIHLDTYDTPTINSIVEPLFVPKTVVPAMPEAATRLTPDAVSLSFLPAKGKKQSLEDSLPLVISPKDDSSAEFLKTFLKDNREWVDKKLLHHGAILFRDFDLKSAPELEAAIQSFQPKLNNQYRGTSPRDVQPGTKYIFSAAEAPAHFPIYNHLEMSFLPSPPRQLFFGALQAPRSIGGETAVSDFRKVYADLKRDHPELIEKLATKKLKYTRRHNRSGRQGNGLFSSHDVASMQGWEQLFGTSNKAKVEELSGQDGMPVQWKGKNKDVFVSEFVSEPFQLHPVTKQPVWFNHIQVFHPLTFPAELFASFRRTKQWRFLLHAVRVTLFSLVWYGLLRQRMALDVSYGDGSRLSLQEMIWIREAMQNNLVANRWKQGDLLMLDNFSTSHGRQPTYDSGRKIVVAWADPIAKANEFSISNELSWE